MAEKHELESVVQGNSVFTKRLYNVLAKEDGNVFFSPISVHTVLAMAHQGANGKTHDDMATALHVPNSSVAAEGYKDILVQLNNIRDVQLSMANKIYVMRGYSMKPAFQEINAKKFLSSVEAINFANTEDAAGKINAWVERKTKNKIKDLIHPAMLGELIRLVLVNAIYFKGTWAKKFEARNTRTEKFYSNDNDYVDVQMMNQQDWFSYKEDHILDAKVLELPYLNQDISLVVILPNKRNGIAELEKKLIDYDILNITEDMRNSEVIVKLPKFKIETTIDLNDPLKKVGLQIIFDPKNADFSEMLQSPEPLYVSQVIQKAFIEVNEEGTEAAASTLQPLQMSYLGWKPEPPKEFYADHPFVVLLKNIQILDERKPRMAINNKINNILFLGRIARPQKCILK